MDDPAYVEWCGARGACRCGGAEGVLPMPGGFAVFCPCPAGWARYQADLEPVRRSMAELGARLDREAAAPTRRRRSG